jgi:hypothetical protein
MRVVLMLIILMKCEKGVGLDCCVREVESFCIH